MASIEDRVKKIVEEQLDVKPEQVVPDALLVTDLGADSLDTVEVAMALEEEFEIEITDEEGEAMVTVRDAMNLVEKALA